MMTTTPASALALKRNALQYVHVHLGESAAADKPLLTDVLGYLGRSGAPGLLISARSPGTPALQEFAAAAAGRGVQVLAAVEVSGRPGPEAEAAFRRLARLGVKLILQTGEPAGEAREASAAWVRAAGAAGYGATPALTLVLCAPGGKPDEADVEAGQWAAWLQAATGLSGFTCLVRPSLASGKAGEPAPVHGLVAGSGLSCQIGFVVDEAGALYDCLYNLRAGRPLILAGRATTFLRDLRGADLSGQPIRCGTQCGRCAGLDGNVVPPVALQTTHAVPA